jgi:hypothetical protein
MTDTIDDVAAKAAGQEPVEPAIDEQSVAEQLVAQAREKGIELVGPRWAAQSAQIRSDLGHRRPIELLARARVSGCTLARARIAALIFSGQRLVRLEQHRRQSDLARRQRSAQGQLLLGRRQRHQVLLSGPFPSKLRWRMLSACGEVGPRSYFGSLASSSTLASSRRTVACRSSACCFSA